MGSGAGNDSFIAHNETGETGKVIGIDFIPAMIEKARQNAEKLGFHDVLNEKDINSLYGNNFGSQIAKVICPILPKAKPKSTFRVSFITRNLVACFPTRRTIWFMLKIVMIH